MAKFHGIIGYIRNVESKPGVWEDEIIERTYSGDVIRNTVKWSSSSNSVNDNLTISNQISIVADSFAYQNSYLMKYVEFMGTKWKIENIDIQRPRLILTLGGVYNGEQA